MPKDSTFKTVQVATGICLFCSLLVSTAAVKLNPRQEQNKKLDKIKNILVAGSVDIVGDLPTTYEKNIEEIVLDMARGVEVAKEDLPPDLLATDFDTKTLMVHPEYGEILSAEQDTAKIKRRPKYAMVYRVKNGTLILPMIGKGLWSTMYGFLALESDLKTAAGITFYEHGETPGLGGEVDNPRWKDSWKGKQAFDDQGQVAIRVIKGTVNPDSADAIRQIDGLSGATITTRGLDDMVQYWLGEGGFGPYLKSKRLREDR